MSASVQLSSQITTLDLCMPWILPSPDEFRVQGLVAAPVRQVRNENRRQ